MLFYTDEISKLGSDAVARRKSVAKREGEFIETVVQLSSFGIFIITYLITSSFQSSLTLGLAGLFLSIAFLIYRKVVYINKLKSSKISDVDKMSGIQFEKYLKLIFEQKGYKAQNTKTTGDFGADLILKKGDKKIIIQAKRYNSRVGIKAVQEAVSAVQYYKATEAWVVTNNEFTGAAIELARANKVRLIERDELMQMAIELKNDAPILPNNKTVDIDIDKYKLAAPKRKPAVKSKVEPIPKPKTKTVPKPEVKLEPKISLNTVPETKKETSKDALYTELKEYRLKQAMEEEMKPYLIFYNSALDEIIDKMPTNVDDLLNVKGFGKVKGEKYGPAIIEIVSRYR
ncbi:restriction endonuclease [Salipaludibacillus sp. HK11]|uniref:restriction endonuclease n=1 Tax=Salipaludibacillus sp. HK11 TaxID=3394320 RepID=UPI0039FC1079